MNRIISVAELKDGMIIYDDILTPIGTLLVNKGTVVDVRVRDLLIRNEVFFVKIVDESQTQGVERLDTHLAKLRASARFQEASKDYQIAYDKISNHFDKIMKRDSFVNKQEIFGDLNKLLNQLDGSNDLFDLLNGMKLDYDSLYMHSLNTGLLSNILGRWLKFSEAELQDLTLAGLFHDIGMLTIPADILQKDPEERTEEETELVKKHTIYGYRYLMKRELNRQIGLTALTHHERMDGTGYPLQCIGSSLCTYSRIVAIVDAYDELTLTNERARNPFHLIEEFERDGLTKFDPQFIMVFLAGIMDTYIGYDVLLDNNEVGTIIYINRDNMSRPMIKVGDKYINLAVQRNLNIMQLI